MLCLRPGMALLVSTASMAGWELTMSTLPSLVACYAECWSQRSVQAGDRVVYAAVGVHDEAVMSWAYPIHEQRLYVVRIRLKWNIGDDSLCLTPVDPKGSLPLLPLVVDGLPVPLTVVFSLPTDGFQALK